MTRRSPLQWPAGWPRAQARSAARFDVSLDRAERLLRAEIDRIGGQHPLITHDRIAIRREPADPGVAVYFSTHDKLRVFACDRWSTVRDNMRAIGKTIEALRGIARWGASDMMDRAFSGFEALPAPKTWREVLGIQPGELVTLEEVEARYRSLAKAWHPDKTDGDEATFKQITEARDAAREELA